MKSKIIILTLVCAAMVFSFTACNESKYSADSKSTSASIITDKLAQDESVQVANPWISCASLEKAEKAAGFTFEIPQNIERYARGDIQVINNELIDVYYQNKEKTEDYITIRKGVGTDDISGDYNEYENSKKVTAGEYEVTLKGNNEKSMLAIWTSNGYSYSVFASSMGEDEILKIVEQIK